MVFSKPYKTMKKIHMHVENYDFNLKKKKKPTTAELRSTIIPNESNFYLKCMSSAFLTKVKFKRYCSVKLQGDW